jgi:hypothetical protein
LGCLQRVDALLQPVSAATSSAVAYILRRRGEGCRNGVKLYREIREREAAWITTVGVEVSG